MDYILNWNSVAQTKPDKFQSKKNSEKSPDVEQNWQIALVQRVAAVCFRFNFGFFHTPDTDKYTHIHNI